MQEAQAVMWTCSRGPQGGEAAGEGMETEQGEAGKPRVPTWQSQGRKGSCRWGKKQECRGHGRREGGRIGGYLQRHPLLPRAQVRCPLPTITSDQAEEARRVGSTPGTVQLLSKKEDCENKVQPALAEPLLGLFYLFPK